MSERGGYYIPHAEEEEEGVATEGADVVGDNRPSESVLWGVEHNLQP